MNERLNVEQCQPHAAPAEPPAQTSRPEDDLRRRRIFDHHEQSLQRPSSLEANLGALNSDLMLLANQWRQVIEQALAAGPVELGKLEGLQQPMDTLLKLAKQIDRFAQLDLRLQKAAEARGEAPPGAD